MRWWLFSSEILGTLSAVLLVWGFITPKGSMTWRTGDGSEYERHAARLKLVTIFGFVALGSSFAIKAAEMLISPDSYALEEKCGKRAREIFKTEYQDFTLKDEHHRFNFQNHFSARLNKCFLLVVHNSFTKSIGDGLRELELFDVNENKRYGLFIASRSDAPKPVECDMRGNQCQSEQEWMELAKPYLED